MPLKLDFDDLPSEKPVKAGRHRARLDDWVYEKVAADNERLVWSFTFLDGDEKDKTMRMWTGLSPKAKWKIKDIFVSIGWTSINEETGRANPIDLDWDPKTGKVFKPSGIGKIFWLDVSETTYNDKPSAQIDMVYGTAGSAANGQTEETGKKKLV